MTQHKWQPGESLAIGTTDLIGGGRNWRIVHGFAWRPDDQGSPFFRLCDDKDMGEPQGWYTSVADFEEFGALRRSHNRPEMEDVCAACVRVAARMPREASA